MTSPNPPATAPNASIAMARVLVDELARCGLRHAVVAPGSRSTSLAIALDEDERVRVHVCLDERSAAFVALGVARACTSAAAVVTTSGSAVANLHPAVVEAHHAQVPLLLLTADRPPELRGTAANQTIDQPGIFGSSVRWSVDPGVPADVDGANAHWRSTIGQAWARAHGLTAPPGPVHVNLPFREPTVPHTDDGRTRGEPFLGPLDGRPDGRPWVEVRRDPQAPAVQAALLADRIREAERALVVLGAGHFVPAPVTQLARAAEVPLLAEPLSNGRRGGSGIAHGHLLVAAGLAPTPDLVVRVGRTGLSRPIEAWLDASVPQVLVDPHGSWFDPSRSISDLVVADADAFLAAVARLLREDDPPPAGDRLAAWRDADAAIEALIEEEFATAGLAGPVVARRLVQHAPHDAALVVASSAPIRDVDAYAPLREDLWITGNRGASGIDGFTSTALGIALARPGPTVALAGDLSFLHDRNGWLLRPDGDEPDVVMVVVDNNGGGLFHQLPVAAEPAFERLFATPHDLDLAAVGDAHGLRVRQPATVDAMVEAVAEAVERGGRNLVHVRTDRQAEAELRRRVLARVRSLPRLPA